MGTSIPGGTTAQGFWEGKVDYVNHYAPGTTTFEGMVDPGFVPFGWKYNSWLQFALPTFDWLWTQLSAEQDIELGIDFGSDLGHALTLTSLCFNDINYSGRWDPNEAMMFDYIDPNNPTAPSPDIPLTLGIGGLHFNYKGVDTRIRLAYAESPEPSVVISLLVGVGSFAGLLRRRRS